MALFKKGMLPTSTLVTCVTSVLPKNTTWPLGYKKKSCSIHNSVKFEIFIDIKIQTRPNKKTRVFRVAGLNILGRVGRHIFF